MDIFLPTTDGLELHRRIIAEPDPALKALLEHLRIRPPKTFPVPPNVVEKTPS